MYGLDSATIDAVFTCVVRRKGMNIGPVACAANLLDPRFCGSDLSEAELQLGVSTIMKLAANEQLDRQQVLNDLTEYRSKTGLVFGDELTWEAVLTPLCSRQPEAWWKSVAPQRQLTTVAIILMSMPATAALIERCNKAYAVQKTKVRNRLIPTRAAALASVAYNLNVSRSLNEPTTRQVNTKNRVHIVNLSVTSALIDMRHQSHHHAQELASDFGTNSVHTETGDNDTDTEDQHDHMLNSLAAVVGEDEDVEERVSDDEHQSDSDIESSNDDHETSLLCSGSDTEFVGVSGASPLIGD